MRTLEEIANSTPPDYLAHAPRNPFKVALQMISVANQRFPRNPEADFYDPTYYFLYFGPGAGNVIKALITKEHKARGVETSKRAIASSPEDIWTYISWKKPWELSQGNKAVDVCFVNSYLQTLLTPEEWSRTEKEIERVSKHYQIINAR